MQDLESSTAVVQTAQPYNRITELLMTGLNIESPSSKTHVMFPT